MISMNRLMAFLLGVYFAGTQALACECPDAGPFLVVARNAPLIVRGVVLAHIDHGLDFEVRDVYEGREMRKTIRVWGDNGRMCRRYASELSDGTEWVLALYPAVLDEEIRYEDEKATDYPIVSCGEFSVRVEQGPIATRNALGLPDRVSVDDLRIVLASGR
jgi:hypothetical protein